MSTEYFSQVCPESFMACSQTKLGDVFISIARVQMLLIVVDAKPKWLEITPVLSTNLEAAITVFGIYSPVLAYRKALSEITKLAFTAYNLLTSFSVMVLLISEHIYISSKFE